MWIQKGEFPLYIIIDYRYKENFFFLSTIQNFNFIFLKYNYLLNF